MSGDADQPSASLLSSCGLQGGNQQRRPGITVRTGDGRIDQGSLLIRAERGEFEQKEGEVSRVVLDGSPVHLEQDIDQQGRLKADAKRIEYLLSEQKVVMTGGVRIERPRGLLTGARVIYHLDSDDVEAR